MAGLTRKEIQKDQFRSILTDVYEWLLDNSKYVGGAFALVVLLAVGGFLWGQYRNAQEQEAQDAFSAAMEAFHGPVVTDESTDTAGLRGPRFSSEEERDSLALTAFQEVSDKHSGSSVGSWAQLYTALIRFRQGEDEEAKKILEELSADASPQEVSNLASKRLCEDAEQAGAYEQAITYCTRIIDAPADSFPIAGILFRLAQSHEKNGDSEAALDFYRRLNSEYPNAPEARTASQKIAEMAPQDEEGESADSSSPEGQPS